jgi:protein TonB
MRILGFILSAAVLHVVVLALSPDSSNQQVDEFLVGVELIQRQLDSIATADTSTDGQESISTDRSEPAALTDQIGKVDEAEVANSPELVKEQIETKLPLDLKPASPQLEEQPADVEAEDPTQPIPEPYKYPLPDDAATPDNNSVPALEQVIQQAGDHHAVAENTPVSQPAPVQEQVSRPAKAKKAGGIDGSRESLIEQVAAAPRYGYHPAPAYPRRARDRGWEGTVELKVRVLPSGKVGEVKLINSSGYKSLDQAARRAIKRWRFTPASRAGGVVESWVVVPVHFVLDAQTRSP